MALIDISMLDPARTVVVATGNAHKLTEIEAILGQVMEGFRFVALGDLGDFADPVEDGETFYDNALIKAQAALDETGLAMAVADDSGLCVDALGGDPGIHSARWAGEHGNDAANNELLLKNLSDKDDRSASFVCTIALIDPTDPTSGKFFRGETEGVILHEARGKGGFGYDPLFFYEPMGLSFSEMSAEQKNSISHRGKAIELLAEYLKQLH